MLMGSQPGIEFYWAQSRRVSGVRGDEQDAEERGGNDGEAGHARRCR
jgi:hypothetical protein